MKNLNVVHLKYYEQIKFIFFSDNQKTVEQVADIKQYWCAFDAFTKQIVLLASY